MGGKEKQAGGGQEPAGPSQPDLGRKVVPLKGKDGSLPATLGRGEGKEKKPKAVALALLSLKGKADVLMS